MGRARRRQLGGVDRLPSGRWRVRMVDPTTDRRVSIGSFKTKAEAERTFATAMADQQRGAWVAPGDGRITLTEYSREWLGSRLTSRGERLRLELSSCTRANSGCTSCRHWAEFRSAR